MLSEYTLKTFVQNLTDDINKNPEFLAIGFYPYIARKDGKVGIGVARCSTAVAEYYSPDDYWEAPPQPMKHVFHPVDPFDPIHALEDIIAVCTSLEAPESALDQIEDLAYELEYDTITICGILRHPKLISLNKLEVARDLRKTSRKLFELVKNLDKRYYRLETYLYNRQKPEEIRPEPADISE